MSRHSWLSNHRQESVAEHTWRMSLMAILLKNKLTGDIDLEKVLKMIIIHDLVEIEAGDISVLEILRNPEKKGEKEIKERYAIESLRAELDSECGNEIYDLWHEFKDKKSPESKYANAMDKLEVQIQHNNAPLITWEDIEYEMVHTTDRHVDFDEALIQFNDMVVEEAEQKISAGQFNRTDEKN